MKITVLECVQGTPFLTRKEALKQLGIKDKRTLESRLNEIRQEVRNGRYDDYAIIEDGGITLINYMILIDYMKYRRMLKEKNLRKHVPDYEPQKIAKSIGWYGREMIN